MGATWAPWVGVALAQTAHTYSQPGLCGPNTAFGPCGLKTNIPCGPLTGAVAYSWPIGARIPWQHRLTSAVVARCGGNQYVLADAWEQGKRIGMQLMSDYRDAEEAAREAGGNVLEAVNPARSIIPWVVGGFVLLYVFGLPRTRGTT